MDQIILTPRLKLTLITKAERGSQELAWLHKLHSNEQATWWSILGQAKSITDTENIIQRYLPSNARGEEPPTSEYRIAYAVHQLPEPPPSTPPHENDPQQQQQPSSEQTSRLPPPAEFIGLVTLKSLDPNSLALPEHLTSPPPPAATPPTLTLELAYMFLPSAWGHGHATESVSAALASCARVRPSFWAPFATVYVRAIVNAENAASLRVVEKVGMVRRGVYEWRGERVFVAGGWRERDSLWVFGEGVVG